jgi:hypothetical protein
MNTELSERARADLRRTLGEMESLSPLPPELETRPIELRPQTRATPRPFVVAIGAAAAVFALVLPIALMSGNRGPSDAPTLARANDPMVLLESPLTVRGPEGPEPLFDTSALGQEARLVDPADVTDTVSRVEDNLLSPEDEVIRYVIAGSAPSGATAGLVETSSGLHWCLWVVPPTQDLPTCSGSRSDDTDAVANFNPLSDAGWQQGTLGWGPLPAETSVVAMTYGDQALWQRPVGGIVLFDISNPSREEVVLTAYDSSRGIVDTLTGAQVDDAAATEIAYETDPIDFVALVGQGETFLGGGYVNGDPWAIVGRSLVVEGKPTLECSGVRPTLDEDVCDVVEGLGWMALPVGNTGGGVLVARSSEDADAIRVNFDDGTAVEAPLVGASQGYPPVAVIPLDAAGIGGTIHAVTGDGEILWSQSFTVDEIVNPGG